MTCLALGFRRLSFTAEAIPNCSASRFTTAVTTNGRFPGRPNTGRNRLNRQKGQRRSRRDRRDRRAQASAFDITSHNTNVPETNAASLAEDRATRHGNGMQPDSRPSEEPCGTTSNQDGSICLDNDEWDRRFPFSHQAIRRRSQVRRIVRIPCHCSFQFQAVLEDLRSVIDPVTDCFLAELPPTLLCELLGGFIIQRETFFIPLAFLLAMPSR